MGDECTCEKCQAGSVHELKRRPRVTDALSVISTSS
jgi:hypothetical protein